MNAVISEAYREEQQNLHKNPSYGSASIMYAPMVSDVINTFKATDVLDYGAGKGRLSQNLTVDHDIKITMYDPAIPQFSEIPEPHELVVCIDVLEHIEPEYLDAVLDDLQRLTKRIGIFTIHTGPAIKVLSDGRNAHLTQESPDWWLPKIMKRFNLKTMNATSNGFHVIVKVKNGNIDIR